MAQKEESNARNKGLWWVRIDPTPQLVLFGYVLFSCVYVATINIVGKSKAQTTENKKQKKGNKKRQVIRVTCQSCSYIPITLFDAITIANVSITCGSCDNTFEFGLNTLIPL